MVKEEDNMPLQPLREAIVKFQKRRELMNWLLVLSLPSAIVGIAIFAIFALILRFSILSLVTFAFLAFSSIVSYLAILYIPGALNKIIKNLEFTLQEISFSIMPATGDSPSERLLNQLTRTDRSVKEVLMKNPKSKMLDVNINGSSGKSYSYDLVIHNVDRFGRFFKYSKDINIFAKRFDQINPLSVDDVKRIKESVQDVLTSFGRKFPTRVLVVSTSGFEDEVFAYVRSKNGSFYSQYLPVTCRIELIQEKLNGNYDILSF